MSQSLPAILGTARWDQPVLLAHSGVAFIFRLQLFMEFFAMGSCKNLLQYLLFSLTEISISCDLVSFFPETEQDFAAPSSQRKIYFLTST